MTDRELLELAARAAGLDLEWCDFWGCMAKNLGVIDGFDRHTCWNSLQDDCDALRLAVKLRITVEQDLLDVKACAYVLIGTERKHFTSVSGNVSREEATRRAITRAAAQIQLDKEKQ